MSGSDTFEERRELADRMAQHLHDQLDRVLGDRLQRPKGRKPEWDDFVNVTSFDLAERCGRRAASPAANYADSVHNARRRVGLLVLRRWAHEGSGDLSAATRSVLDDPAGWPDRLWVWTRELDPAARSAVGSAALTWASALARTVPSDARPSAAHPPGGARPYRGVTWADPAMPPRFEVPGRLVRLGGSFDASAGRPRSAVLLVVADGVPAATDRLRAGLVALVRTVQHRLAPLRVSLAAPSRGAIEPVVVDESLLRLTVDHVVELVALRSDSDAAVPRPSGACQFCHLLDDCPEGTAYLRERSERSMTRGTQ